MCPYATGVDVKLDCFHDYFDFAEQLTFEELNSCLNKDGLPEAVYKLLHFRLRFAA